MHFVYWNISFFDPTNIQTPNSQASGNKYGRNENVSDCVSTPLLLTQFLTQTMDKWLESEQ